jgi:hypothetical protein
MSILDDAIREHLELKRAHGADAIELKRLEDEAFGPPGRPDEADSFSEGPTEFLAAPATDAADAAAEAKEGPGGRSAPNITDLQEAPEASQAEAPAEAEAPAADDAPDAGAELDADDAPEDSAAPEADAAPAVDDAPAAPPKDEAPPAPTGPTTEERHAIASQPTEFFGAGSEQQSPTDDQLLDSKLSEPRLAPAEPAEPAEGIESTGPDAEVVGDPLTEDDDDFFSEQRLSDELNQALEAPVTDEHEALPELPSEEHETVPPTDEHEAAPYTDEHEVEEAEEPSEEHTAIYDLQRERQEEHEEDEDDSEDDEHEERGASKPEDVLEDTPDFLEDAPEDDELWFEQKPPKDFDFDD